jgi:hypothetical protein
LLTQTLVFAQVGNENVSFSTEIFLPEQTDRPQKNIS